MDTEPPRQVWALYGMAGALVWGTLHLVTVWRAGTVSSHDIIGAVINVVAALIVGTACAAMLGPALAPMVPIAGLRDPYVVGFGVGAGAFELLPIALTFASAVAKKFSREKL